MTFNLLRPAGELSPAVNPAPPLALGQEPRDLTLSDLVLNLKRVGVLDDLDGSCRRPIDLGFRYRESSHRHYSGPSVVAAECMAKPRLRVHQPTLFLR